LLHLSHTFDVELKEWPAGQLPEISGYTAGEETAADAIVFDDFVTVKIKGFMSLRGTT
jgi:hypothetical protein